MTNNEPVVCSVRTALAMAATIIALESEKMPQFEERPTFDKVLTIDRVPTYEEVRAEEAKRRVYRGMLPHVDTRDIDVDAVIRQSRQARLERNRKKLCH